MSKPTFVFVPGAWHTPTAYDDVITGLASYGFSAVKVALPSVGAATPTYDFTEDVIAIRDAVTKLIEQEEDIVVVAHSYSGQPMGEIPKDLGKMHRESMELKGGVIRLVFIMALLVPEGFQVAPRNDISSMSPCMKADIEAGIVTVGPEDAKRVFYNDLPDHEASRWAAQLQPQSIGVFWSTSTTAAWRYIPSTCVLCGNDQSFTKAYAEVQLKAAMETDSHLIDVIEECNAGHFPMLSQVEWTVGVLRSSRTERRLDAASAPVA